MRLILGLALVVCGSLGIARADEEKLAPPAEAKQEPWKIDIAPGRPLYHHAAPVFDANYIIAPAAPRGDAPPADADKPAADVPADDQALLESQAVPFGIEMHPMAAGRKYADIYCSIPFIRSEYEANPSYRHDATMEILFGQMRPTVVHKHITPTRGGRQINWRPTRPWFGWRPHYWGYWGAGYGAGYYNNFHSPYAYRW